MGSSLASDLKRGRVAWKREVVEVDVALQPPVPWSMMRRKIYLLAFDRLKIDDDGAEFSLVLAGCAVEDAVVVSRDDIDASLLLLHAARGSWRRGG